MTTLAPSIAVAGAYTNLEYIIDRWQDKRVLLVGDSMLDIYRTGQVARLNPEAPVPVLANPITTYGPGGAAHVARQLHALGAIVHFVTVVGADHPADLLRTYLGRAVGSAAGSLIVDPERRTTCKIRYLCGGHHLLRVDTEETERISGATEAAVVEAIRSEAPAVDGILVSDYAKGVFTPAVSTAIFEARREHQLYTLGDIKPVNAGLALGMDAWSPNLAEAREMLKCFSAATADDYPTGWHNYACALMMKFDVGVFLTLGAEGIFARCRQTGGYHIAPERPVRAVDVSGCGDTAAAVILLAKLAGASDPEAARLANLAAGLAAEKPGTAAVGVEELRRILPNAKGQP